MIPLPLVELKVWDDHGCSLHPRLVGLAVLSGRDANCIRDHRGALGIEEANHEDRRQEATEESPPGRRQSLEVHEEEAGEDADVPEVVGVLADGPEACGHERIAGVVHFEQPLLEVGHDLNGHPHQGEQEAG